MKTLWRIAGVFLLNVLAGVWLVCGPFGIVCYVGGLFNWMRVFLFVFLAMPPGLLLAVVVLPVLVTRAVTTWGRRTREGRRRILVWLVLTGGFVCPFVLGLAGLTVSPFDMYVRGFRRYAACRVNVVAIQSWLATLDPNDPIRRNDAVDTQLAESELPSCIAELAPKHVLMQSDETGRPTVRFFWGSGFIGSWGMEVGPRDMPTPPSDSRRSGEQRYALSAGAYVWSGN
jgi:hypothetical protein